MNGTTQAIIGRLPKKDLVTPREIADAYDVSTTTKILQDIKSGVLAANGLTTDNPKIGIEVAKAYILAKEIKPTEGTLPIKK